MAASSTKKKTKRKKLEVVETDTGAWERFEHAVDAAVKSGPQHRVTSKAHKPKASRKGTTERYLVARGFRG